MNKGVEILLSRMESNPDEFFIHNKEAAKWRDIVEQVYNRADVIHKNPDAQKHWAHLLPFLSDEEILELHNKLQSIRAEEFTQDIMRRLLDEDDQADTYTYGAKNRYRIGWENIPSSTITLGGASAGNYHSSNTPNLAQQAYQQSIQNEAMRAQMELNLQSIIRKNNEAKITKK